MKERSGEEDGADEDTERRGERRDVPLVWIL